MKPKVGFMASGLGRREVAALEELGVDSLWAAGHVTAPVPMREAMMAFARLATLAETAIVGSSVVALPLYQPGLLAKQLAEIDSWTAGRTIVGIGVGGEYAEEFRLCEVPIEERGPRADEMIPLLRRLWSGELISHEGRFHQFDDVRIDPPPVQVGGPPVVVAGRRPVAMRRAALLGDGWMPYLYSASRYATSVETIRTLAADAGRDLSGFHWMATLFLTLADDPDEARATAARALGETLHAPGNPDFGDIVDRVAVTGDVEGLRSGIQAFLDAGAQHLILTPLGGHRAETARRLMTEVVPQLTM